jgi:hypothetical protein
MESRARTAGGLAGFLAPTIYFEVVTPGHQPDDVGGWAMTMMLAGYLLGALIAEIFIDPPRNCGVGGLVYLRARGLPIRHLFVWGPREATPERPVRRGAVAAGSSRFLGGAAVDEPGNRGVRGMA